MTEPKKQRGGARPGAGRKPGKSPRHLREQFFENLNSDNEVKELVNMWDLYKRVAVDKANNGNTEDLQWIFSRILPVPKEQDINVDHTTKGESLNASFNFPKQELSEWSTIPITITTKDIDDDE